MWALGRTEAQSERTVLILYRQYPIPNHDNFEKEGPHIIQLKKWSGVVTYLIAKKKN